MKGKNVLVTDGASFIGSHLVIALIGENEVIIIYDLSTGNLVITFIKDVINIDILAAKTKVTGVSNVAVGRYILINESTKFDMKIIGKDLKVVSKNFWLSDIMHSYADISKAKKNLDYEPRFNLTKGVEETFKWFQKYIMEEKPLIYIRVA